MKEGFEDLGLKNIEISDREISEEEFIEKSRKLEEEKKDGEIFEEREIKEPKVICDQLIGPGGRILVPVSYECPGCNKFYKIPPKSEKKVNNLRPSFYYYCRKCGKELGYSRS